MKTPLAISVCVGVSVAAIVSLVMFSVFTLTGRLRPSATTPAAPTSTTGQVSPLSSFRAARWCDKDLYQTATLKNLELPWTYGADDAQLDQAQHWVDAKRKWVTTLAEGCERDAYEEWLRHIERLIDKERALVVRRRAVDALAKTITKPPR